MNEPTELCLRARIARARRAAARGVTLIEVLIVVAILSLIAAGVTVAVFPKLNEANIKTTEGNAREIRNAIQRWRGLKGGTDCPTISQLVQDKEIDSASKTDDAWGVPFKITCTEDDVIVLSAGPDKKEGTKDDISVPKGAGIPKLDAMALAPIEVPRSRAEGRRFRRAFTLIEVMVVVVIGASLMAAVVMGIGAATNAKLKGACTLVSSAIRSGYTRASATGKPQRIVMDFTQRRVWIEEGTGRMLVQEADLSKTGGADPATEAEKKAQSEADRILKGPRAPKTSFKAVKNAGIADDDKGAGRELGGSIRFREVMSNHQVDVQRDGRAYLYMWPGGQTELAYIQIAKGEKPTDSDTMTLFVHPLTGRVKIVAGAKTLRVEETASEREDKTF
jgi:general secretion pathway protein H